MSRGVVQRRRASSWPAPRRPTFICEGTLGTSLDPVPPRVRMPGRVMTAIRVRTISARLRGFAITRLSIAAMATSARRTFATPPLAAATLPRRPGSPATTGAHAPAAITASSKEGSPFVKAQPRIAVASHLTIRSGTPATSALPRATITTPAAPTIDAVQASTSLRDAEESTTMVLATSAIRKSGPSDCFVPPTRTARVEAFVSMGAATPPREAGVAVSPTIVARLQ